MQMNESCFELMLSSPATCCEAVSSVSSSLATALAVLCWLVFVSVDRDDGTVC